MPSRPCGLDSPCPTARIRERSRADIRSGGSRPADRVSSVHDVATPALRFRRLGRHRTPVRDARSLGAVRPRTRGCRFYGRRHRRRARELRAQPSLDLRERPVSWPCAAAFRGRRAGRYRHQCYSDEHDAQPRRRALPRRPDRRHRRRVRRSAFSSIAHGRSDPAHPAAARQSLSVVVPVYNEEAVLPEFHRRLAAAAGYACRRLRHRDPLRQRRQPRRKHGPAGRNCTHPTRAWPSSISRAISARKSR